MNTTKRTTKKTRTDAEVAALVVRVAKLVRTGALHADVADACGIRLQDVRALSSFYGGLHSGTVADTVATIRASAVKGWLPQTLQKRLVFQWDMCVDYHGGMAFSCQSWLVVGRWPGDYKMSILWSCPTATW